MHTRTNTEAGKQGSRLVNMVTPVQCLFFLFLGFYDFLVEDGTSIFLFLGGEFSCRFLSSKGRGDGTARGGAGC